MPKKKFQQKTKLATWLNECPYNKRDICTQLRIDSININKYIDNPDLFNSRQLKALAWICGKSLLDVFLVCNKIIRAREYSKGVWFNECGSLPSDYVTVRRVDAEKSGIEYR